MAGANAMRRCFWGNGWSAGCEEVQSAVVEIEEEPEDRSEFLIAIDPGHFVGRAGNRTPQMPDIRRDEEGNLVPYWGNVDSQMAGSLTAPSTITTPDGEVTIFTEDGVTTPSGWNVSADRRNPAYGIVANEPETERIQMREWEFNNAVAVHLIGLLEARGYSVLNVAPENDPLMSGPPPQPGRDPLNGVSNTRRVGRANNTAPNQNSFGRRADYYLSIHANAAGNPNEFSERNGIETYYQSEFLNNPDGSRSNNPSNSEYTDFERSRRYAHIMQRHLHANGYGQRNIGVKRHWRREITVLFRTEMPTSLIEAGFFTNFREAILLMDTAYRQRTAEVLANAIDEIYEHWRENQP